MNRIIIIMLTATLLLSCTSSRKMQQRQLSVSVLGDSYSTYEGYMATDSNLVWYFPKDANGQYRDSRNGNDVSSVEQTWWHLLCSQLGYRLEQNNSFSGSTICYTGYRDRRTGQPQDYTNRSFVSRVDKLGQPDIILICGGTNDSWAGSPIGEYKWADWTPADLKTFRPAMACLLSRARELYPKASVWFILNNELKQSINESVDSICARYAVPVVHLHDIDKQAGHPSVAGMRSFASQVAAAITSAAPTR